MQSLKAINGPIIGFGNAKIETYAYDKEVINIFAGGSSRKCTTEQMRNQDTYTKLYTTGTTEYPWDSLEGMVPLSDVIEVTVK